MYRFVLFPLLLVSAILANGQIVADSLGRQPLGSASVFSRDGSFLGTCRSNGQLPYISASDYPVTVRYLGYKEKMLPHATRDTIFLEETITEFPEVVVTSKKHTLLHMLAYVREFSTLTSYTDTVFLFREKMVDFMLPAGAGVRFKGWTAPRILAARSYYRFTNSLGLDSVSDRCNQHFSWADWIGVCQWKKIPARLGGRDNMADTVRGRYGAVEKWSKSGSRITVDVDILADTISWQWVPELSLFIRDNVEFDLAKVQFCYDNVLGDELLPVDLSAYSFNIQSRGRGRNMFMFNRVDQPFFVDTYAEVYIMDKEYIPLKEARKWEKLKMASADLDIYEPAQAPELQPSVRALIERVNTLDHDKIRLNFTPDQNLVGCRPVKMNVGQKVLKRLKGLLGIDEAIGRRKFNKSWKQLRKNQLKKSHAGTD